MHLNWDTASIYAAVQRFHKYGMILTRIDGRGEYMESYKDPAQEWKPSEQTKEFLESIDWESSTGIGLSLGYNDYRAIDIDFVDTPEDSQSDSGDDYVDQLIEEEYLAYSATLIADSVTR